MAAAIGQFSDAVLEVTCPRGREVRRVRVLVLGYVDGQARVETVLERMRCSMPRCGARPSVAIMVSGKGGMMLVGPGALG